MNKLCMLLAAALLGVTSVAHAVVVDWGGHQPVEVAVGAVGPGSFLDIYEFSIPTTSLLGSVAVSDNLGSLVDISGGTVALFSGLYGGADSLVGAYAFDGTTGSSPHVISGLTAGDYFYAVEGDATGEVGGTYELVSAVEAIPEPEDAALLVLGLVGMVASSRWRKKA